MMDVAELGTLSRQHLLSDSSEDLLLTHTEVSGLHRLTSQSYPLEFVFDRLAERHGEERAELTVNYLGRPLMESISITLTAAVTHKKLAGQLGDLVSSVPWDLLLPHGCATVLKKHRAGEPPVTISNETPIEPLTFSINPIVFKGKISILYSNGGQGKSTFALLLAMLSSVGGSVAGFSALKGNSLFLDFEDDVSVHARRLQAIQAGHPDLVSARVAYRRCVEPLHKFAPMLVRQIQQDHVQFVVVDSLLAATGGDSSAEATTQLFIALRALNVSVLLIGHTPKNIPEGQDTPTLYGSVFNSNFARATWELKKEQEVGDDRLIIGLLNRKSNLSRLRAPIGLQISHEEGGNRITFEPYDLADVPDMAAELPLPNRIRNLLESDGTPRYAKAIADELGASLANVRTTLSRNDGRKWVHLQGEGKELLWTVLNARN
ncbi:MAG: AAA family ATPase [Nitrospira sp. BO4]|jgi:hypothetical protein|nr:AAA family ATPase [Nitrospira sp. BO4]